jgi:hypothetical protein
MGSFFKSVPVLDYVCLLGFLLAGVLLMLSKPFSLYLAVAIVAIISVFGVVRVFDNNPSSITEFYLNTYTIAGSLLNILILVVLVILAKNKKFS